MLDEKTTRRRRWSYYYEYLKNAKIRKARKQYPEFRRRDDRKIKSDEMTAQELRDKLPVICDSPKTLRKMLSGEHNL